MIRKKQIHNSLKLMSNLKTTVNSKYRFQECITMLLWIGLSSKTQIVLKLKIWFINKIDRRVNSYMVQASTLKQLGSTKDQLILPKVLVKNVIRM
jgi:hypothetical protein